MQPDFARTRLDPLSEPDLHFLLAQMPGQAHDFAEVAGLLAAFPSTVESMLSSARVFDAIQDPRAQILTISPFLYFNVLLRHALDDARGRPERRVINYLANLLALFLHGDRALRADPEQPTRYRYMVELLAALEAAPEPRKFILRAHIGNYALWLTGMQGEWLEQRHRYGRRAVAPEYYAELGQGHFHQAARDPEALRLGLEDVFMRLALLFDYYRAGLRRMRGEWMAG